MSIEPQDLRPYTMSMAAAVGLAQEGDPQPSEYLAFAQEDLSQPDSRASRTNSLSNGKRALHLQVELLTDALGYARWPQRARGFPPRLEFARKFGLAAPPLLERINRLRNLVEHSNADPDRTTVEDYVDSVELLLDAFEGHAQEFPLFRELRPDVNATPAYCLRGPQSSGRIFVYSCGLQELLRRTDKSLGAEDPDFQGLATRGPKGVDSICDVDLGRDGEFYFEWAKLLLGTV